MFPVASSIDLLAVNLLYYTCELATGLHFIQQKKKKKNAFNLKVVSPMML